MTLQNLSRILDKYEEQFGIANSQQFQLLKNLPFYGSYHGGKSKVIEHYHDVNLRTFNHAIGLPQKNGQSYPLFDYEQLLYDTLQQHRHVWIKKATGLGVTEFMLRYMAWLCFRSDRNNLTGSNYTSQIAGSCSNSNYNYPRENNQNQAHNWTISGSQQQQQQQQ